MILKKKLAKNLAAIASKEPGRYAMNQVFLGTDPVDAVWDDLGIDEEGRKGLGVLTATDGRVLVVAAVPTVPGDGPGLISKDVLKAAAKDRTARNTSSTVALGDESNPLAEVDTGKAKITLPRSTTDGEYPRYAAILHPEPHPIKVALNGHYLAKVATAIAELGDSPHVEVSFKLDAGSTGPIRIQPTDTSGPCGVGYVMPVTVDHPEDAPIASVTLRNCLYHLASATGAKEFDEAHKAVVALLRDELREVRKGQEVTA